MWNRYIIIPLFCASKLESLSTEVEESLEWSGPSGLPAHPCMLNPKWLVQFNPKWLVQFYITLLFLSLLPIKTKLKRNRNIFRWHKKSLDYFPIIVVCFLIKKNLEKEEERKQKRKNIWLCYVCSAFISMWFSLLNYTYLGK